MKHTLIYQIKQCIEQKLSEGKRDFIIFPFGDIGIQVKHILNNAYGIQERYIIDNNLCKYNDKIKELSFLDKLDCKKYCLILACTNSDIYGSLKLDIKNYFKSENIAELSSMFYITKIGKYSYGPICGNHALIESIGAFCSFAPGVDVVFNHEMQYITTHPIIYSGANQENYVEYSDFSNSPWYFEGVQPKKELLQQGRRIRIGNDVWLGQNVLITNYANIGNGVIAGAGSIITKDIPDYAVVVGVPARIVRYRYSPEQIVSLNKIAWWDWTDEEIKERYNDLYLPIDKFINKYS